MEEHEYQLMSEQQRWHWWYVTKRAYLQAVLEQLHLPSKAKILDLGCGVGANLQTLSHFGEVTAVEKSVAGVHFAQQLSHAQVVQADINTYHIKKNQFDVITILDVLYHQNIQDDRHILEKALRAVKSSGYVIVMDCMHPWLFGPHDVANMARERYSRKSLEQKVSQAGGMVVRSSYTFCFSFPLFVLGRLWEKWTGLSSQDKDHQGFVNSALAGVGKGEARFAKKIDLPVGSSLMIIAVPRQSST